MINSVKIVEQAGMVVHVCNTSTQEAGARRIMSSRLA
jgi:hypothetical protein